MATLIATRIACGMPTTSAGSPRPWMIPMKAMNDTMTLLNAIRDVISTCDMIL